MKNKAGSHKYVETAILVILSGASFFFLSDNSHLCLMLIKKIIGTDEMPWILIPGL